MSRRRKYSRNRSGNEKKRISFGEALFRTILWISALALILSYVSVYVNPTLFWIPMFFAFYFEPLCLLNFFWLILLIIRKKRTLLIPLVALLPSLIYADRFVKIGTEQKAFGDGGIKVLTYNLGKYDASRKGVSKNEAVQGVNEYIRNQNPDVVCLQEFAATDTSGIDVFLPKYPYKSYHMFKARDHWYGNVTLSRYPIVNSEYIAFENSRNLCLVSDIETEGTIIRLFNCHLESYSLSFTSVIKRLSNKENFTDEFINLHEHIREATEKRAIQVDKVLDRDSSSVYPAIICGDFNDTPVSYVYHKLQKDKTDSFVESGSGFSSTYSVLWPLLRIDYILFSKNLSSENHSVGRIPYSDHYPVVSTIHFQTDN